jgi:hypothetical protein
MSDLPPTETVDATQVGGRRSGRIRRWLTGGAIGIALAAVLLGGTALAQSESDGSDLNQTFVERLAGKLGMSSDDLQSTIKETQAEVIDDAVANGQLTEEQGNALKDRIESGDGPFRLMPGGPGFGRFAMRHLDFNLETIATELGMTTDELRTELESGSTLSEVITAHGSTVEAVVDALVTDAKTQLDAEVADGSITQAQADQILTNLPDRLTQMIENGFPAGCDRWFDNGGSDDSDNSEETSNHV